MDQKRENRIGFVILGIIFAGFTGYFWGQMQTAALQYLPVEGAIIGILIALTLLAIGQALKS